MIAQGSVFWASPTSRPSEMGFASSIEGDIGGESPAGGLLPIVRQISAVVCGNAVSGVHAYTARRRPCHSLIA